jgi:hypothetical protein
MVRTFWQFLEFCGAIRKFDCLPKTMQLVDDYRFPKALPLVVIFSFPKALPFVVSSFPRRCHWARLY